MNNFKSDSSLPLIASSELPSDVAFEILTRTSLETLDTCKVVSKTWKLMTYESSFMQSYCRRTNNISGYFIQGIDNSRYISEFVSMDDCSGKNPLSHLPVEALKPKDRFFSIYGSNIKIEASSKQGILCCVRSIRYNNHRYYICKPSTQEWKVLPNPKLRYSTVKVALVVLKSNPLHFKIIRLSKDPPFGSRHLGPGNYCCEIFDSETNAWRQANMISLSEDASFKHHFLPINASGLIYLLTTDDQVIVLNYDGEEAYPRFYLPEQVARNEDYTLKKIISYEGKLGFICLSPSGILELWCIDNRINHFWRKEQEVETENIKRVTNYPSPIDFYNSDVILLMGFNVFIFYKKQNANLHVVELDRLNCPTEIFPFCSDVEPINWPFERKREKRGQ
ncbi:F-box protein like [Capsicum chacoense]